MIGAEGTGFATASGRSTTPGSPSPRRMWDRQGALDYALGYVQERKQFGKALAEFRGCVHARRHGDEVEAARQLTYAAAAKSERGDADLTYFGAAAKCFASDVAMEITTDAVQLLGGYGYTRDFRSRDDAGTPRSPRSTRAQSSAAGGDGAAATAGVGLTAGSTGRVSGGMDGARQLWLQLPEVMWSQIGRCSMSVGHS